MSDSTFQASALGYSIALLNVRQEIKQIDPGAIYWLSVPDVSTANRLAGQSLEHMSSDMKALLLSEDSPDDVLAYLKNPDAGPSDLRTYRIRGPLTRFLVEFCLQLDRAVRPRDRLIILHVRDAWLALANSRVEAVLRAWRNWLENNGCALLLISNGENAAQDVRALAPRNNALAGLAALKSIDATASAQIEYRVVFWRSVLGVTGYTSVRLDGSGEFLRHVGQPDIIKSVVEQNAPLPLGVETVCQRSILEGALIPLAENWHVVDTWSELSRRAYEIPSAVLIFAMTHRDDIEQLARLTYELRVGRGESLRIIVREMGHLLRQSETKLLQDCGVSQILTQSTLQRFFATLEETRDTYMPYKLTDNLELTLAASLPPPERGVISRDAFCHYMDGITTLFARNLSLGVMVVMRPAPAISAALLVSQLQITRAGDVACVADGHVYLFLFSCQPDYVLMVLRRLFRLPFQDVIMEHRVFSEYESVEEHVSYLRNLPMAVVPDVATLSPSAGHSATSSSPSRFHPVLGAP